MIAVLRVRFPNTDVSSVWSDATFESWLNPAIPFSLGNYWWEAAWGYFDLSYQLFPTIVMPDPRPTVTIAPGDTQAVINAKLRGALVNGAIAQATASVPFWDAFDIVLIWYAQRTDTFGGGDFSVPLQGGGTKTIKATVVDVSSPFDNACQELGHGFGLDHEIDAGRNDYRSPYSAMSAQIYGDTAPAFLRSADARLPDGLPSAPKNPFAGLPAGRVVGPGLTPAQLLMFPWFQGTPRVVTVPPTYTQFPARVKLFALDHARALSQSALLPVMAVLPPNGMTGYWYTVELRRTGPRYDRGIGGASGPPEGLVVHSYTTEGRVRYEGVLPLAAADGDTDWTSTARLFTLRRGEIGPNNEWVEFEVMNGPFQQQRRVDLDEGSHQATDHKGEPVPVLFVQPCVRGVFSYTPFTTDHHWTLFARSYGFESPKYRWCLNGTRLQDNPGGHRLNLHAELYVPAPPVGTDPPGGDFVTTDVAIDYEIVGNRLTVDVVGAPGNIAATIRVVASTSASIDPFEVAAETTLQVKALRFDWDRAYKRKLKECYGWMDEFVDRELPHILINPGDPPPFHLEREDLATLLKIERVMHGIRSEHPDRAAGMLDYLVQRYNVPRAALIARQGRRLRESY